MVYKFLSHVHTHSHLELVYSLAFTSALRSAPSFGERSCCLCPAGRTGKGTDSRSRPTGLVHLHPSTFLYSFTWPATPPRGCYRGGTLGEKVWVRNPTAWLTAHKCSLLINTEAVEDPRETGSSQPRYSRWAARTRPTAITDWLRWENPDFYPSNLASKI